MSAELEKFFTEITNRTIDARKEAGQVRLNTDQFIQPTEFFTHTHTHKVGNNGIKATFVFPHNCSFLHYYRSQRSYGQGNVFSAVCDSVLRGVSAKEIPPRRRHPLPR